MLMAICHSPEDGWVDVDDLGAIAKLRRRAHTVVWAEADLGALSAADVTVLQQEFGLHPLAVDNARSARERPKLEPYDKQLLLVVHQLDTIEGHLEPSQIACLIGDDFVLTLHDGATRVLDEAKARWKDVSEELAGATGFLMYSVLDAVVDDYESIADRLEEEVERLEEQALSRGQSEAVDKRAHEEARRDMDYQLYALKQQVSRLRRYAFPAARALDWIVTSERHDIVRAETEPYFRDVHDHLEGITEQIESVDSLANAVLNLQRSAEAAGLSEINKRLTAWAAIIAVPTLISSIYGMNFELVPKSGRLFGFWFALALMAGVALALFTVFKRKRWIG